MSGGVVWVIPVVDLLSTLDRLERSDDETITRVIKRPLGLQVWKV
jgi:hypothetical protein